MTEIKCFDDLQALAEGAAAWIVRLAADSLDRTGRFSIALSGGSTPKPTFRVLAAQYAEMLDWSRVHVFWGDERCVPPDNQDSNYRMAMDSWLGHISIPEDNIRRIRAEQDNAAEDYERVLRAFFGEQGLQPRFDLVLLGLGTDGHTASLFPETAALDETERWVVANYVRKFDSWRITLTAPAINMAANIAFLVSGEPKAEPLREVVNGRYRPRHFPAQLINPVDGRLLWMVDEAACIHDR